MKKILRLIVALWFGASASAFAANITYQANNLNDALSGQDLWEYRYSFSGPFDEFDTVQILFDPALYSALEGDSAVGDWTILITQPDPMLPADGLYDAIATVAPITIADEFVVRFVWLGGTAIPGSQAYRVLNGDFDQVAAGGTQPKGQVPEPDSIVLLMVAGLTLLAMARRRRDL